MGGGGRADKNKFSTVDGQSFRSLKIVHSYKVALLQRDENHPNGVEKLQLFLKHISIERKEGIYIINHGGKNSSV